MRCGVNCAIAAKATSPIEASEFDSGINSAHTSASAMMAMIDQRRVRSIRRPSVPAAPSGATVRAA